MPTRKNRMNKNRGGDIEFTLDNGNYVSNIPNFNISDRLESYCMEDPTESYPWYKTINPLCIGRKGGKIRKTRNRKMKNKKTQKNKFVSKKN